MQRYVPGLDIQFLYLLKFVRETDKPRPAPGIAPTQESEAAIVESAAHTESIAPQIEGH